MSSVAAPDTRMRRLDQAVVAAGLLLVATASAILWTGYPIRKLLFPSVFDGDAEPVGHLLESSGALRRKTIGQAEFEGLQQKAVLFNRDTLVTGGGSTAVFEFEGGTRIELEERTMVIVERPFALGAKGGDLVVSLVKGRVKAKPGESRVQLKSAEKVTWVAPRTEAALGESAPQPTPTVVARREPPPPPVVPRPKASVRAEILSPPVGAAFRIPAFSIKNEFSGLLSWRLSEAVPTRTVISYKGRSVLEREVPARQASQIEFKVAIPGKYEATVEDSQTRKVLASRVFELSPVIEGVKLLPPLVAGQKMANNAFMGSLQKDFKVDFRWEGPVAVHAYRLDFFHAPTDRKAGISFDVKGNRLTIRRSQAFNGTFYYQVVGVAGPFSVVSRREPFRFDFLPPLPTVPADGATVKAPAEGAEVLFTWQKTNFTESYRFELSRTNDFSKPIFFKEQKENFLVIRRVTPGTYFWRVQGVAGKVTSVPSQAHRLTLSNR